MSKKMSEDGYNFNPDEIAEKFDIIVEATCEDIIRQRQRLGGDWAVSTFLNVRSEIVFVKCFIHIFRPLLQYFLELKEI